MSIAVSVTNMKGGVGKTTVTANLGHCLATLHDKKVLLVDVDPQFNLTQYCMNETDYEKIQTDKTKGTVFNIFIPDRFPAPGPLTQLKPKKKKEIKCIYEIRNNLFLIPSSIQLIDFIDQRKSGGERLLSTFIDSVKDTFDFVLIDCPPTSTILSRAAYLASDGYLIPMGMDYFSVMGIPLLYKDINDFTETYGKEMKGLGILKTRYLDWTKVSQKHRDVVDSFSKKLKIKIFNASFTQRQEVQNALSERKFIIEHNKNCQSSKEVQAITEEFLHETTNI
jgi:chromosome partitioning protein